MRRSRFTVKVPANNENIVRRPVSWTCDDPLTPELKAWLADHGSKPKYQRYGPIYVFAFKTEQEALMFSSRWL